MSAQSSHGMPPPDFSKPPLMNRGNLGLARFPASPMHNSIPRLPFQHPRFGRPGFNQPPPWGSRSEMNNFNGGQTALRSVSPRGPFTPDNIFGADGQSYNTFNKSRQDSFPFPGHQNNQNNFGMNGSPFQGHPNQGRGRSFMRGNRGGPRLRGGGQGGFNGQQFRGQQDQGGHNKKRKEKIDKRDLPENNVFFCDICDRGFKTEEKYKEHTDGHIQCSYKDCPFIAAPKLVQLHMNMQHRSGLAKKVWSLESEEDVKKWREERKRNFPTAENIAKKKQQEAEKLARGELLHTKDFSKMRGGKNRDRGRGKSKGRRRGGGKWKDYDKVRSEEMQAEFEDGDKGPPDEVVIKHGDGEKTTNEKNGPTSAHLSSTETVKESQSIQKEITVREELSGLGLLSAYGFSSSSEDEEETPVPAPKIPEWNGAEILESQPHLKSTNSTITSSLKPKMDLLPNPFVSTCALSSTASKCSALTFNRNSTVEKVSFTEDSPQKCGGLNDGKQDEQINKTKELIIVNSSTAFNPITTNNQTGSKKTNAYNTEGESLTDQLTGDDHIQRKINIEPVKQQTESSKREHNFGQTSGPPSKKSRGKSYPPLSRKYTLLEKLLAPDIRRERNKILQCVHYIVKNKFFESVSLSQERV